MQSRHRTAHAKLFRMSRFSVVTVFLFSCFLLGTHQAEASLSVHKGIYETAALIRRNSGGDLEAVFNLKTQSEFRVVFYGPKSKTLQLKRPQVLFVRFKIVDNSEFGEAIAELLAVRDTDIPKAPAFVGEDLKPAANEGNKK